ncbi:MAG: hypothetical protein K2Q14_07995, partial [Gammaproteobacteria bacterium]|nr:hypothetical protein [Gammaproteobacteria bacterium]
MKKGVVIGLIGLDLLLSFFLPPAPLTISLSVYLIGILPFVIAFYSFDYNIYKNNPPSKLFLTVFIVYLFSIIFSAIISCFSGISWAAIIRATASYLAFSPLVLIAYSPYRAELIKGAFFLLIASGLIQVSYHLYLFFSTINFTSPLPTNELVGRITILDPRVTLPLILSATILPLYYIVGRQEKTYMHFVGFIISFIGLLGTVVTLTRAMLLAEFLGVIIYYVGWVRCVCVQENAMRNEILPEVARCMGYLAFVLFVFTQVPVVSTAFDALVLRSTIQPVSTQVSVPTAQTHTHTTNSTQLNIVATLDSYSDGRLKDEWIPVLTVWDKSTWFNHIFGMGEGTAFMTAS